MTPPLSTDLHRYAWDARVQAAGINPYRYRRPTRGSSSLRDDHVYPGINLRLANGLPPGAEASFLARPRRLRRRGSARRPGSSCSPRRPPWRCSCSCSRASGAPLERVGLYAWHPLAVSEIAANGHVDALAVLAGAGLLAAWQARRFALAGVAVAFGALVKLGPLLLVPALAGGAGRRLRSAGAALAVAAYVPYLSVGTGVFGDLRDTSSGSASAASLWWAARAAGWARRGRDDLAARRSWLARARRRRRRCASTSRSSRSRARACSCSAALLLAVSLRPALARALAASFFAVTVAPGWLWLTGTLPLLYLFGLEGDVAGVGASWRSTGRSAPWVLWRVLGVRSAPAVRARAAARRAARRGGDSRS